jgi:hypothetical protein
LSTTHDFIHPEDVLKILKNNLHGFITEQEDVAGIRFKNNEGNYFWFEKNERS